MQEICPSVEIINKHLLDDRLEVLQLIGVGGMACVYLAQERHGGHLYALKILHDKYRNSEKHREIFRYEAETMQRFQHPNIVRFYKYVEDPQCVYIRMDYIKGISLHRLLTEDKASQQYMPIDDVMRIIWQVAQGLDYLHREKQLHLDVKPANVLIESKTGKVYLTDLGLTMDNGEVRTYVAGTPYYMPYEQQLGHASVTTTADTYALAIMLYELLTLHRPFEVDGQGRISREQIKEAHRVAKIPSETEFDRDLPQELNLVFRKALAKDPSDRYEVQDFIRAAHQVLRPALSDELQIFESITTRPLGQNIIDQKPIATASKHHVGLMAGLGIIVGLVAILALLYSQVGITTPTAIQTSPEIVDAATVNIESLTVTKEPLIQSDINTIEEVVVTASPVKEAPTKTLEVVNGSFTAVVVSTQESNNGENGTSLVLVNTAEPSNLPIVTDTLIPTMTYTLTPTQIPTDTHTPTMIIPSATPTMVPTAFLSNEPILYLVEGVESIGVGASINEAIGIFAAEEQAIIPLRSGIINGFYSVVEIQNPSAFESYGIAYRIQSLSDFWMFRIVPERQTWEIVEVSNTIESIHEVGNIDHLPERIAVAGRDGFFRYEFDQESAYFRYEGIPNGYLGIWLIPGESGIGGIQALQVGLLGDEAIAANENMPTLVPAMVDFSRFLKEDLTSLLNTATIDGKVVCQEFVEIIDRLERHLVRLDVKSQASQAILQSNFIYNRCQTSGTDTIIELDDAYVDFLTWQTSIKGIIDILIIKS